MTLELRTWQVNGTECAHSIYMTSSQTGEGECKECDAKLRWVIPDTRLQTIAGAWRKYITPVSPEGEFLGIAPVFVVLDALVGVYELMDTLVEEPGNG